jgi:hypothetical protein
VGQTASAAAELALLASPARVAVIPTPMPPLPVSPLNGHPRALFCDRLTEEKDLPVLLEAWVRLLSALPEARLTIAGRGLGRKWSRARCEAGCSRIHACVRA